MKLADRVTREARTLSIFVLTMVAGIFYVTGWIAGATLRGIKWGLLGIKVGFQDGIKQGAKHRRSTP